MRRSTVALKFPIPPHISLCSVVHCPSRRIRHTLQPRPAPLVPPVRSGMFTLASEFTSSKGMRKQSRQSSSHPTDLFWRRHLLTIPYVYGICMLASRPGVTPPLVMPYRNVEPFLQPFLAG